MTFWENDLMKEKQIQQDKSVFNYMVPAILLGFAIFLLLKFDGVLDPSHRNHIRNFESDRDRENLYAMTDDNAATVWGDLSFWGEDTVPEDTTLTVYLDSVRPVRGIWMLGTFPSELSFYGWTGEKWQLLAVREKTPNNCEASFKPMETDRIKIEVTKSEEGQRWEVGEIDIYENE